LTTTTTAANTKAMYGRLDARQRQIIAEKRFAGRLTARALIDLLGPVARFEAAAARSRASLLKWMTGGIIGTVATGFLALASGAGVVLLPLPLAGIAVALGAGLRYRRLQKLDLSNNLGGLVMPLLAVLREETDPAREVEIDLDLRAPTAPEKLVDKQPLRHYGGYEVVDSLFRDAWMSGSAQLHDGARLGWSVVDEILEQKRTKRNPRGKVKTKTRYKKRSLMKVAVALPDASFALAAAAPTGGDSVGAGAKVRVQAGEGAQTIKLGRVVKSTSLEPPDARGLIDLLAAAYRRVDPRQGAPRP
jgi:hypothetical protein